MVFMKVFFTTRDQLCLFSNHLHSFFSEPYCYHFSWAENCSLQSEIVLEFSATTAMAKILQFLKWKKNIYKGTCTLIFLSSEWFLIYMTWLHAESKHCKYLYTHWFLQPLLNLSHPEIILKSIGSLYIRRRNKMGERNNASFQRLKRKKINYKQDAEKL